MTKLIRFSLRSIALLLITLLAASGLVAVCTSKAWGRVVA